MVQNTTQYALVERLNHYQITTKDSLFTGCDIICFSPKKFYAFNKSLVKFWKEYNETAICLSDDHLSFAENFQYPPIIFHFNFLISEIVSRTPILSDKFIEELVKSAQEVIHNKIMIENNDELICYFLKSNDKQLDGMTNVNLQIRFPYLHMNNHEQKTLSLTYKQLLISTQVFFHSGLQFIKPYESLIIDYSANNPFLYGSGDDLRPRLFFINAYSYNEQSPIRINLFQTFDIRKHYHKFKDPYFKCQTQEDYQRLLPFFTSMYYGYNGSDKTINNDDMAESLISETSSFISPNEPSYFRDIFKSETRIDFPNKTHVDWLLEHISPDRLHNDDRINERLIVGRALYNVYSGGREGLEKWLNSLDSEIDRYEYQQLYHSFNTSHKYTAKTLLYWAKLDDPHEYQWWHFKQCEDIYEDCLYDLTDANVAMALYRTFAGSIFYLSDLKEWYEYKDENNKLIKCDSEMLYQTINYKFCLVFENMIRMYDHTLKNVPNMATDERDVLMDKRKKCTSLISKLRGVRFKNNVIAEAKSLFAIHQGLKNLDTDPNILCVQSGIFEFYKDQIYYRDGLPEDFVSKSTGVPFDPDAITSQMRTYLLDDVLRKIYPDPEILNFIIDFDAISLKGGNAEKLIMFLISPGNTGKSTASMIKETMFGDYAGRYEYSDLTVNKRQRGGPDPARAEAANCRHIYFQETGRDIISSNVFKTESGNEPYRARKLNKDGGVLKPLYRLIGSTNFPPVFDNIDDAIINRCLYVPHWSTFSANAPDDIELQWKRRIFKPNLGLSNIYGVLAKTYLCILYERYNEVAQKGLLNLIPNSIKKFTRQFFSGEDKMNSFLVTCIEHYEENSGHTLKTGEIYERYRTWMRGRRDEPESLNSFTLNIKNYLTYMPQGNIHYNIDKDEWENVGLKGGRAEFSFQSNI